jgi:23S rRNA pseudouridine1911/1915/1917 synthase
MKLFRKGEWLELWIPHKWNGYTIEYILKDVWGGPNKQIHQLRMENGVMINGEPANWQKKLSSDDKIQIKFFSDQEFGVIPSYYDINILYEDDHLLVVNKPKGIDTHPNEPNETDTLANAVAFYLQSKGESRKIFHIQRLDRNTTGAILFAKHPFIGAILDRMLEERKIKRTYLALTDGILKKKHGTIDSPIGRDRHHPTKRRVSKTGQKAVTHYKLIKILQKQKISLIQCDLDTGRTHQIRVHLSSIGHPISGDTLYGGKPIFPRQALHAGKLMFIHPLTAENIVCYAPFLDRPPIFPDMPFEF